MSWFEILSFIAGGLAAFECAVGRLAKLDRKEHRHGVIAAYFVAACVCIVAASLAWQGIGAWPLDLLALGVAGHLLLTAGDWRRHAPASALQDDTAGMVQVHADIQQDKGL